jgi:hypothetical protein
MKKFFFNVKIIIPALVLVFAAFALNATLQNEDISAQEFENQPKIPRAVIIDQLSVEIPNKTFQNKAIKIFEDGGYDVDLIESQNLTVDFYKNLPSLNYDYIVVRSHAVPQKNSDTPVVLFTGETYSTEQYISEQLWGHVVRAAPVGFVEFIADVPKGGWTIVNDTYRYYEHPVSHRTYAENEFFGVSPKLVDEAMVGKFDGSIILLGGCGTLSNHSLAKSLLNRGASTVVGWDDLVGSGQNDRALLALIEDTITNNADIKDAVNSYKETANINSKDDLDLKYFSQGDL